LAAGLLSTTPAKRDGFERLIGSEMDVKPVSDFVFDVPAISLPINRSKPSRFAGVVDKSSGHSPGGV
jgi:hypothetical protein